MTVRASDEELNIAPPGRQARRYGPPIEPGEVVPRRLGDLGIRCFTSISTEDFIGCFIPTTLYPGDDDYELYARRLPVVAAGVAIPDGAPGRHRAPRWRWPCRRAGVPGCRGARRGSS